MCVRQPERNRRRRLPLAATALIALAVVGSGTRGEAQPPSFFYRATGQANASFIEIRRPGYILEPLLQLNPLDTQTTITSAGTRDSLASLLNPGPIGDFPSLIGLAVSGLPPIPYAGYPLTVRASYPITPDAVLGLGDVAGGGAADAASARPFTAEATAAEDGAGATGTGSSLGLAAGLVQIGGIESAASSTDNGGTVTVTATSHIAKVDIANLVAIDDVRTTSAATIDSTKISITTATTVGAIHALGAELAVDDTGLHVVSILGLPAPPAVILDSTTKSLTDALAKLGLDVRLVQGGTVEGPADAKTPVQALGAGLQITVPVTIAPDVAIPSIPGFPLGIPVGGGIPTNVTVSLARTAITAVSGTQNGFAGNILAGAPPASASRATAAPAPAGSAAASPRPSASTTAAPAAGAAPAASPSQPRAVPAASRTPDLTPAFRWTVLTALVALLCGWPLARRRVAGVPGLSASAVLLSLTDSGRRR